MRTLGELICKNPLEILDELAAEREESVLCLNCPRLTWNQELVSRRDGTEPERADQFCSAECEGEFNGMMMYFDGKYYYPGEVNHD